MKKRTTQPKNNKYYIRQVSGGLNGAVAGKPTISGANVLCNCVGYANGRFNEAANDPDLKGITKAFRWQLVCNAENFIESAKKQGLKISSTPVLGGIMVWQKGSTLGGGDGAGHVAFVEAVYTDGTILTSESGWNAWAFRTVKRSNANGRWSQAAGYKFRGCIINPAIKSEKTPAPKDDGKLAVDGIGGPATVKAMQRFFGTTQDGVISGQKKTLAKYYPALKSVKYGSGGSPCIKNLQRWAGATQDGVIGQATVKAWQKKIGVKADGIFGSASMKAWQKYLNANDKAVYPPKPAPAPAPKPSTGAQKILAKAKEYAWAYGTAAKTTAYKTGKAKAAYKTALKKWMKKTAKISQSDCGYFVSTCVRASGVSSTFLALPASAKKAYPAVPSTMKIVSKGNVGTLQPGDIIRYRKTNNHQHVVIYLGDGMIAHAGRGNWFPKVAKGSPWNNSNVKKSTIQVIRAR